MYLKLTKLNDLM